MQYSVFVERRRELWDRFEAELAKARRSRTLSYDDLERLARDYRRVLQDYAWARSRYPDMGATARLAALVLDGHAWLQRGRGGDRFSIVRFFSRVFPRAMRRLARPIGVAAGLFLLFALLGFGIAVVEPGVAFGLLGPDTIDDLESGRLWTESLTTTVPPAQSSSRIATNNMSVAITAWAGGALFGLGAIWIVAFNGGFLGAVFGATAQYSMAGELLEFVAAHGPLELTLIVVASGAGLAMGLALVVATDRPRREVIRSVSRDALVILIGCLPFFLALAVVEALVSPSPDLGWEVKLAVGLALEAAFVGLVVLGGEEEA